MKFIINDNGCCPNTDAKKFEIILIVGFILALILLIINFGVTFWFFKFSHPLLIIEIVLLALNVLSIILTIILRVWRRNRSIFDTNFWSSIVVIIFNLEIVIINFLLSIVEEVLFSFVFQYIIYNYYNYNPSPGSKYNDGNDDSGSSEDNSGGDNETLRHLKTLSPEDFKKISKNYCRIMDKFEKYGDGYCLFHDFYDSKDTLKKLDKIRILPWIAFNFNILVQIIMFIFIIILMGRIKRQSDFGFPQNDQILTSSNRKLGKRNSRNLNNLQNNFDSTQKNFRKKKRKKNEFKKERNLSK